MIQSFKVWLQDVLKTSSVGRCVYPRLQRAWRSIVIPIRRKRLRKYGYDALSRLHGLLKKNSVTYHCEAGTLLGIIRDGGFIVHDDDIDICVPPGSVSMVGLIRIFLNAGYEFVQCLEYEGSVSEFTVRDRTGIPIDVFTCWYSSDSPDKMFQRFPRWSPDRKYPNERANHLLEFEYVRPTGVKVVKVHGAEAMIPKNYVEVLDSEFGPWRVPDPSFKSEMLKHKELPGFCYRIDLQTALAKDSV